MRNKANIPVITGTSSIVDEKTHEPILSILTLIVETVAKLRKDGHRVVLVSSGAVGVGLRRMNVNQRPTYLPRIQVRAYNAWILNEIQPRKGARIEPKLMEIFRRLLPLASVG